MKTNQSPSSHLEISLVRNLSILLFVTGLLFLGSMAFGQEKSRVNEFTQQVEQFKNDGNKFSASLLTSLYHDLQPAIYYNKGIANEATEGKPAHTIYIDGSSASVAQLSSSSNAHKWAKMLIVKFEGNPINFKLPTSLFGSSFSELRYVLFVYDHTVNLDLSRESMSRMPTIPEDSDLLVLYIKLTEGH